MRLRLATLVSLAFAPSAASAQVLASLEVTHEALIGDLGGTAFGQSERLEYGALRGLRLDNVDVGLPLARAHRLVGRFELGLTDDDSERGYLLGAVEVGYRYQPSLTRQLRPFVAAGVGWVGGGVLCGDEGAPCGDRAVDPQVHLQAGMDVDLAAGWSGELRLPVRYLFDVDLPLAAFTLGLRHSM